MGYCNKPGKRPSGRARVLDMWGVFGCSLSIGIARPGCSAIGRVGRSGGCLGLEINYYKELTSVIDNPLVPLHTTKPKHQHPSVLSFIIMPSNSKAKNNGLKLTMPNDKPDVHMIEKDGPLVDSPVDIEESQPGDFLQDVRDSHLP